MDLNEKILEDLNYRTALVFHCKDLDGLMSATVFKAFMDLRYEDMYGYDYEKDGVFFIDNQISFMSRYENIIFVDVTPSSQWLQNYLDWCKNQTSHVNPTLHIVDHHKVKVEELMVLTDEFSSESKKITGNFRKEINNRYLKTIANFHMVDNMEYQFGNHSVNFVYSWAKPDNNLRSISAAFLSIYFMLSEISIRKQTDNRFNIIWDEDTFIEIHTDLIDALWLVSEYDVWNFDEYLNEDDLNKVLFFQLALNDYIQDHLNNKKYDKIIDDLLDLFLRNARSETIPKLTNSGKVIFDIKTKLVSQKTNWLPVVGNKSSWRKYIGNLFVIVHGDYPEYITQKYFKNLFPDLKAMIFLRFKPDNNIISISVRQGNDKTFDCIQYVKDITNGLGGGHFAATGSVIDMSDYVGFLTNFFETDNDILFELKSKYLTQK